MGSRALKCVSRALNRHDPDHDPERWNVLSGPGYCFVSGHCAKYVPSSGVLHDPDPHT